MTTSNSINDNTNDRLAQTSVSTTVSNVTGQEPAVIAVIEEQLSVGKQVVETGRVRIAKTVHEEEQTVNIPLTREEFSVERVPLNQYIDTPPAVRSEGDTTIYPVIKEVLVVEKKLVLVEEVRVTKRQVETIDAQQVLLRKEEVTVERIDATNERPV